MAKRRAPKSNLPGVVSSSITGLVPPLWRSLGALSSVSGSSVGRSGGSYIVRGAYFLGTPTGGCLGRVTNAHREGRKRARKRRAAQRAERLPTGVDQSRRPCSEAKRVASARVLDPNLW